jgi:broad specificity phosphatase PhoE
MQQTAFLMRHATPDWTRTDIRYDIPPGPPLIDLGKAEAHLAAQFLAGLSVTHILASPLERTQQTAQIIAQHLLLPVQTEAELAEWREGETEEQVMQRSRDFWDAYWERNGTAATLPLLVTHGGPSRLLLQSLGLPQPHVEHFRAQFDHANPMPPAGIWRIQRSNQLESWQMDLVFAPSPHVPYPEDVPPAE